MKKLVLISLILCTIWACSNNDPLPETMYDVSFTVTAENGATINSIQYRDGNGDLIEVTSATSPWSIDLDIRGGLGLEAVAYGDVPYEGILKIRAVWGIQGSGTVNSEEESLPNDDPNSVINNGAVRIEGRTLPRE